VTVGQDNCVDGLDFVGNNGSVTFDVSDSTLAAAGHGPIVGLKSSVIVPLKIRSGYFYRRFIKSLSLLATNVSMLGVLDQSRLSAQASVIDPQAVLGVPSFLQQDYWVDEGAANVTLRLERLEGLQGILEADYLCVSDSAVSGIDFSPCAGRFEWSELDISERSILVILRKPVFQPTETERNFKVSLKWPRDATNKETGTSVAVVHIRRLSGRGILRIDTDLILDNTDNHLDGKASWQYSRRISVTRTQGAGSNSSVLLSVTDASDQSILLLINLTWVQNGPAAKAFDLNCSSPVPPSNCSGDEARNLAVLCNLTDTTENLFLGQFSPFFADGLSLISFALSGVLGAYIDSGASTTTFAVLAPAGSGTFNLLLTGSKFPAVTRSGSANRSVSVDVLVTSADSLSAGQVIQFSWSIGDLTRREISQADLLTIARTLFAHNTPIFFHLNLTLINPVGGTFLGPNSVLLLNLENTASKPGTLVFLGSAVVEDKINTAVLQVNTYSSCMLRLV
jgi:hypothetical protein